MKKLDLYIIKKYLSTYFFIMGMLIIIIIIFDLSEKIESFIREDSEVTLQEIIVDHYLNFIPYFLSFFSPLFIFIAVITFTSKMASNSEIISILSSGISFNRMLFPYAITAIFLCVLNIFLNNFVIPRANETRLNFENKYINGTYINSRQNLHRQIKPNTFIYFRSYNCENNYGSKFSLEKIKDNKLSYKLISDDIIWNEEKNKWTINNYTIREIDINGNETLTKGIKMDTLLNFFPTDFSQRLTLTETLNYFELNDYIEKQKMRGIDLIAFYEVDKHKRFALPFSTIILTLLGVAISSRKVRGGIGMHILFGLILVFAYIILMQISSTLSTKSNWHPFIGVWLPNFVYIFITYFLLKRAPK